MVLKNKFPTDIRVEKEARALIDAGHEIYLLSLGKAGMEKVEDVEGIKVIRIFQKENVIYRIPDYMSFNFFFDSPLWRQQLQTVVENYKIELIHIHDLPLIKTAIPVAKKNDIPLIADLHENYPEAKRTWREIKKPLINRIEDFITPIWRWKKLEKSVLQEVTYLVTVVEEAKDHYINECRVPPEKIKVIMNCEEMESFKNLIENNNLTAEFENNFVITYIGGFGTHRGIDTAIKSMPDILKSIPKAKLLLVGKGVGKNCR